MGIGKVMLYGLGGVSLLGGVLAPFMDLELKPEERMAAGKTYLSDRCAEVTRNRYINGRLGRGPAYCKCLITKVSGDMQTPDEFRYVAKLHSGIGKERWVFQEARIAASVTRVRKDFAEKITPSRMAQINQSFFPKVQACTKAM